MRTLVFLVLLTCTTTAWAGRVSGHITDSKHQALAYASITIKGTLRGTSANNAGYYSIDLAEGEYTLVVQHVGYKTAEQKVNAGKGETIADVELGEQQYELQSVVVKQGEDPAYEIMRNAIKKRKYYETELRQFETEVYIKGLLKLRNYPKRFMGNKVDFEDGDTSKRKIIFLSESVARYYVDEPKKKIEVVSTKVSGNSSGFGLGSPNIFSFYQNSIQLGDLNPRGFISPISDKALNYYRYKFQGTFVENGMMVNRIKVIPKRKYEPLFNGFINIIEDQWRIQSVQLVLYKENQMQLFDTMRIEQLYVPFGNRWVIKQQTLYPTIRLLGFDATGSFVQVYDKFNLEPVFTKNFFGSTILKYEDSANRKPPQYWDSIRPVPLLQEEVTDYRKKDSLEQLHNDPRYVDSLARKRNQPDVFALLTNGQTFSHARQKTSLRVDGVLSTLYFNTVEGAVINLSPTYEKRWSDERRNKISITPTLRYGFSNEHFNASLAARYSYSNKYFTGISISGGRGVYQIDNDNPLDPRLNSLSTLLYERNFMKIYEAWFGNVGFSKEFGSGFNADIALAYQDREPLQNTTTTRWRSFKDRSFTPNLTFDPHQALIASVNLRWQPGTHYVEMRGRKMSIGSGLPTFNLSYTQGVDGVLGSDISYSKWRLQVNDDINFKLLGRLNYNIAAGGFLNSKSVFLPDFQHFRGNQHVVVSDNFDAFQLMPYYAYSNTAKFYTAAHAEYHLNGLLTNKIPVFKKLNWFIVLGNNTLYLADGRSYTEVSAGLENIFHVLRVDYVRSFRSDAAGAQGIRISVPLVLSSRN